VSTGTVESARARSFLSMTWRMPPSSTLAVSPCDSSTALKAKSHGWFLISAESWPVMPLFTTIVRPLNAANPATTSWMSARSHVTVMRGARDCAASLACAARYSSIDIGLSLVLGGATRAAAPPDRRAAARSSLPGPRSATRSGGAAASRLDHPANAGRAPPPPTATRREQRCASWRYLPLGERQRLLPLEAEFLHRKHDFPRADRRDLEAPDDVRRLHPVDLGVRHVAQHGHAACRIARVVVDADEPQVGQERPDVARPEQRQEGIAPAPLVGVDLARQRRRARAVGAGRRVP